ncbi:MAG TPA: ammonium transporter [Polyangiaceae bacterium]|nr:ammonium transporter [Polyangiaceae bacterium]
MPIDAGNTAWLLVSTGLVLVMIPGLALFYGGLVRTKNVISTFMHTFVALGVITLQWVFCGYSLAFGPDLGGVIGAPTHVLLSGVGLDARVGTSVPHLLFMIYQMMFAAITPALVSGAFAERISFRAYLLFILLWSTLVYDPVAHWMWAPGGWLAERGALDFAGGIVVHVTSGVSALVFALVLGKRIGYPREKSVPHNLTMTLLGAGLLWFGWFGFNGGSALAADGVAVLALVNSQLAAAAGAVTWMAIDIKRWRKGGSLGFASGFIAALATITPAAGYVGPSSALVIGFAAAMVCYGAVLLKERLGYDDSLDAFGIHGVGGVAGSLLLGVFAQKVWNSSGRDGLLAGRIGFLGSQFSAVIVTVGYSVVVTWGLLKLIDATVGLRVRGDVEREGLDVNLHGEAGYAIGPSSLGHSVDNSVEPKREGIAAYGLSEN